MRMGSEGDWLGNHILVSFDADLASVPGLVNFRLPSIASPLRDLLGPQQLGADGLEFWK